MFSDLSGRLEEDFGSKKPREEAYLTSPNANGNATATICTKLKYMSWSPKNCSKLLFCLEEFIALSIFVQSLNQLIVAQTVIVILKSDH